MWMVVYSLGAHTLVEDNPFMEIIIKIRLNVVSIIRPMNFVSWTLYWMIFIVKTYSLLLYTEMV